LDTTTRTVTISSGNTVTDIGTSGSNDSDDFHDFLGSVKFEKRDGSNNNVLLAGATFTLTNNATNAVITVTDNGANDADNTAGVVKSANVPLGTYTLAETVAPAGYTRDTTTRTVTVSQANQNVVVGTLGQDDSDDFHNFLGGLTF